MPPTLPEDEETEVDDFDMDELIGFPPAEPAGASLPARSKIYSHETQFEQFEQFGGAPAPSSLPNTRARMNSFRDKKRSTGQLQKPIKRERSVRCADFRV